MLGDYYEPWIFEYSEDRESPYHCLRTATDQYVVAHVREETGGRIVSCVNACSNLKDPAKDLARVRSALNQILREPKGASRVRGYAQRALDILDGK